MYGNDTTSQEARESISPAAQRNIAAVVISALVHAPAGLTRDGISERTGVLIQTVCPTIRNLLDEGRVVETSIRRPTRTGRDAYVLTLANVIDAERTGGAK